MDSWIVVAAVIAAVVVIAAIALLGRSRGSTHLRHRFGDEYDRRVETTGDRKAVEAELRDVERRHDALDLRPLSTTARAQYADRWRALQADFVDRPDMAVSDADELLAAMMRDRGYPVDDFESRVDMVALDHPRVVEHYRAGHAIAERNRGQIADTDQLREALLHYRRLYEELLDETSANS